MSDPIRKTWTIREVMSWSVGFLMEPGLFQTPRLDVELLLSFVLGCKRIDLYTAIDKPLNQAERETFKKLLARRKRGEPIAYLVAVKEFYGLEFYVDKSVLIPRPETELLVEGFLRELSLSGQERPRILDIGTGSGCIAVAIANEIPDAYVEAWDISPSAIEVAKKNATKHGTSIVFREIDFLKTSLDIVNKFDYIVSNPPYVTEGDTGLEPFVSAFEPREALFANDNGREFYASIAARAPCILKSDGKGLFEIGMGMSQSVSEVFRKFGWCDTYLIKDYAGHDRVICAQLKA